MWKIEGQNIKKGGLMSWEANYRLKHITSGKYLRGFIQDGVPKLTLSFEIDNNSLFQLKPILNLLTDKSKKHVTGDAYF